MIRTSLSQLQEGMELALPVVSPKTPEEDLLPAGYSFQDKSIRALQSCGYRFCWIQDKRTDWLQATEALPLFVAQRRCLVAHKKLCDAFLQSPSNSLQPTELIGPVKSLLSALSHPGSPVLPAFNFHCQGLEYHSHAVETCALSLQTALRLDKYIQEQRPQLDPTHAFDLHTLALGALAHDVGYLGLPASLRRHRNHPLTQDEIAARKLHPQQGFQLVRNHFEPSAANIVLNHHQRWDGKGYPARAESADDTPTTLQGETIPIFSRIVAPADTFSQLSQSLIGPDQCKSSVQALFEMRFALFNGWFDPTVTQVFYHLCPPFPVGSRVRLSNGSEAVVKAAHATSPCQPTVQLLTSNTGSSLAEPQSEVIDLSSISELYISEFEGQNVTPFLH